MIEQPTARGSATRTANMNKRRDRILACAGSLIATKGFEAFTLNELASAAGVTMPTIHNLIGKKSQIFEKLVEEMVSRIEDVLSGLEVRDPIAAAEAYIDQLMALFSADEALYKAAFVAGERTKLFEHELPNGIYAKSLQLAIQVCEDAKAQGFLQGRLDTKQLAQQLFACQRLARHDWVHGYIDLQEYRTQVLTGMFITLAADATPESHALLAKKIAALTPARARD